MYGNAPQSLDASASQARKKADQPTNPFLTTFVAMVFIFVIAGVLALVIESPYPLIIALLVYISLQLERIIARQQILVAEISGRDKMEV